MENMRLNVETYLGKRYVYEVRDFEPGQLERLKKIAAVISEAHHQPDLLAVEFNEDLWNEIASAH